MAAAAAVASLPRKPPAPTGHSVGQGLVVVAFLYSKMLLSIEQRTCGEGFDLLQALEEGGKRLSFNLVKSRILSVGNRLPPYSL